MIFTTVFLSFFLIPFQLFNITIAEKFVIESCETAYTSDLFVTM